MNGSTLVSTGELAANLVKWRVFDCRHDLAKPHLGEQLYREGHIPGALFAHLERDLSGHKTGKNGRHPLPEPQDFEKWLEKTGLTPKDQAVCYDAGPGAMAARLWWMLRWIGHDKVAVLDGGFAKWTKEGREVAVDVPLFTHLNYPVKPRKDFAVDVASVGKIQQHFCSTPARPPAIAGSRSRSTRSPAAFPAQPIDSTWTTSRRRELSSLTGSSRNSRPPFKTLAFRGHPLLRLGRRRVPQLARDGNRRAERRKLYAGSWSEWSADPKRPQERG